MTNGEDGLQIWRIAANLLDNFSRTYKKASFPAWGFEKGLLTVKIQLVTRCYIGPGNFSQDRDQGWSLVNTVMNFRIPCKARNFLSS
jgi:hypothetical protein